MQPLNESILILICWNSGHL